MAAAALAALAQNLLLTATVYLLIGFEVTPSTVIGFLTIFGFALYDVVVVFDKVRENTRGIIGNPNRTYGEAANLAVNQTLMRSINTAIVALLPVGGLLVRRRRPARRGHAEGPRPGAVRRHARRGLLVDLLRHPGAGGPEGGGAPVQGRTSSGFWPGARPAAASRSGPGRPRSGRPSRCRRRAPRVRPPRPTRWSRTPLAGSAPRPGARPPARKRPGSAKPGGGKPGGARSGGGRKR